LPRRRERSMESGAYANDDKGDPRGQYLPHISSSGAIGADDPIVAALTGRTAMIGARIGRFLCNSKTGIIRMRLQGRARN
jgi:hypothetical protein